MNFLFILLLMMIATLIGAYGAVAIKKGAESFSLHIPALLKNKFLIIGGLLYGVSILLYLFLLTFLPLSVAYPLTSMSYIWVSLLSQKHLDERMHWMQWCGIALIIGGITLISLR